MALVRTDYGLIYNTDGSLCATLLPEGGVAVTEGTTNIAHGKIIYDTTPPVPVPGYPNALAKYTTATSDLVMTLDPEVQAHSVQAWVYMAEDWNYSRAWEFRFLLNGEIVGKISADLSKKGQWQHVKGTFAGSADQVQLRAAGSGTNQRRWIALAQVEPKPFVTPYTEDTRAAGGLSYDIPQLKGARDFTLHFKFLPYMFKETAWQQYLFSTMITNYLHYYASINNNGTRLSVNTALEEDDTWVYAHIDNPPININSWHRYVMTGRQEGNQATISIYLDGVEVYTSTRVGTLRPFPGILALGTNHNLSSIFNGAFRELYICPYAVSAETVATWHSLDVPFYDPREQIDAGARPIYAPGVQIDSTGAWGVANGVKQAGFGTDGKWMAGGGAVIADVNGLRSSLVDPETGRRSFEITTDGNAYFGGVLRAGLVQSTSSVVVAASDASFRMRAGADLTCDGTGDQEEINAAIGVQILAAGTVHSVYPADYKGIDFDRDLGIVPDIVPSGDISALGYYVKFISGSLAGMTTLITKAGIISWTGPGYHYFYTADIVQGVQPGDTFAVLRL